MNLNEYYLSAVKKLNKHDYKVDCYKEINCGIQFNVSRFGKNSLVRVYQSKKGIKLDLSQAKDQNESKNIWAILSNKNNIKVYDKVTSENVISDPDELIGTDESGKGDYFGPLVIAGVYGNKDTISKLAEIGAVDSKKLSDKAINEKALLIKQLCPYSVVVIGNEKYNELYKKIHNLNRMLAWGHARVIENMLQKVECPNALSDQFGDESLIKSALMEKGRTINLSQRPRAEENVVVAAASILARDEFVKRIESIGKEYNMTFPKGVSSGTLDCAREFVDAYGAGALCKVAKLHFRTTDQIKNIM